MNEQKTIPAHVHDRVTKELQRAFLQLNHLDGISVAEILFVTHAEVMMQITSFFGGKIAAECADLSARRVEHMPPNPVHATATDCVGGVQ